jgi:hypothetical protein
MSIHRAELLTSLAGHDTIQLVESNGANTLVYFDREHRVDTLTRSDDWKLSVTHADFTEQCLVLVGENLYDSYLSQFIYYARTGGKQWLKFTTPLLIEMLRQKAAQFGTAVTPRDLSANDQISAENFVQEYRQTFEISPL